MSAKGELLIREKQEMLQVVGLIEQLLPQKTLSQIECIALGALLQNAYSGFERMLRCLLLIKGSKVEKKDGWHQEILQQAAREGFVSETEYQELRELLKFRHLHMHGYAHLLEETRIRELASPVPGLVLKHTRSTSTASRSARRPRAGRTSGVSCQRITNLIERW